MRSAAAATSMRSSGAAVSKMDELTAAAAALRAAVAASRAALLLALLLTWRASFLMAQTLQTVQRSPPALVSKLARGSTLRQLSPHLCKFWQAPSLHLLLPEQACVGPPQWGVQKEGAKKNV